MRTLGCTFMVLSSLAASFLPTAANADLFPIIADEPNDSVNNPFSCHENSKWAEWETVKWPAGLTSGDTIDRLANSLLRVARSEEITPADWIRENMLATGEDDRTLAGILCSEGLYQHEVFDKKEDFYAEPTTFSDQMKQDSEDGIVLFVKMSVSEWFCKPAPEGDRPVALSMQNIPAFATIAVGMLLLGLLGLWLRKHT